MPSPKQPTKREAPSLDLSRYSRQMLFGPVGEDGQRKLLESRITVIGCGGLGTVLVNTLARAGVGHIRIVDRDYIELNNLQRQTLFDEDDIASNLPKAEAAARKARRINTEVEIEAVVSNVTPQNIESLCENAQLILDGTDNAQTRYLINDLAVKSGRPWIYGACVGSTGLIMPILPGQGPCLRCVFEDPPSVVATSDTAGILGPVVNMVASHQSLETMKILIGQLDNVDRRLISFDAWTGRYNQMDMRKAYEQGDCPCCKQHQFEFLDRQPGELDITLQGRNAVQVCPAQPRTMDFTSLADRIKPAAVAAPRFNPYLFRVAVDEYEIIVFPDGRAIIKGTDNPEIARAIYDEHIALPEQT